MLANAGRFSGEFFAMRRIAAAVTDGKNENKFPAGRLLPGPASRKAGKRSLSAGEATRSRLWGLAAIGPDREMAWLIYIHHSLITAWLCPGSDRVITIRNNTMAAAKMNNWFVMRLWRISRGFLGIKPPESISSEYVNCKFSTI
jgi:hypothetical protein